jgi:hypothetical protein
MNPNPFEAENHLTVPVAMKLSWSMCLNDAGHALTVPHARP